MGSATEHTEDTEAESVTVHFVILPRASSVGGDEGEACLAPTIVDAHRALPLPLSPALRGWQRSAQRVLTKRGF